MKLASEKALTQIGKFNIILILTEFVIAGEVDEFLTKITETLVEGGIIDVIFTLASYFDSRVDDFHDVVNIGISTEMIIPFKSAGGHLAF